MKKYVSLLFVSLLILVGCATHTATHSKVRITNFDEDPASYERLKNMGDKLLPVMDPERMRSYRIGIIEENIVNAFTMMPQLDKDGNPIFTIFFYRGLLNKFDDNELLYVFAHETAHCRLNHVQKKAMLSQGVSTAFMIGSFIIPGFGYLNWIANPVITRAYGRPQEIEADLLAVESIKKCCDLPPDSAITAINKLSEIAKEKGYKEEDRRGILDTHPGFQERIEKIKDPKSKAPIPPEISDRKPTDFKRDKRYEPGY